MWAVGYGDAKRSKGNLPISLNHRFAFPPLGTRCNSNGCTILTQHRRMALLSLPSCSAYAPPFPPEIKLSKLITLVSDADHALPLVVTGLGNAPVQRIGRLCFAPTHCAPADDDWLLFRRILTEQERVRNLFFFSPLPDAWVRKVNATRHPSGSFNPVCLSSLRSQRFFQRGAREIGLNYNRILTLQLGIVYAVKLLLLPYTSALDDASWQCLRACFAIGTLVPTI